MTMQSEKRNHNLKRYFWPVAVFACGIVLGIVSTLTWQACCRTPEVMRQHRHRNDSEENTAKEICAAYPAEAVCQAYINGDSETYDVTSCFGMAGEVDLFSGVSGNKHCPKLKTFPVRRVEAELRQKMAAADGGDGGLVAMLEGPTAKAAAQRISADDLAMAYQGLRYFVAEYAEVHSTDNDPLMDLYEESGMNEKAFQRAFGWMEPYLPLKDGGDKEAFQQLVGLAYGLYQRGAEVLEQHNQAMLAKHGPECEQVRAKNPKYLPRRCLALAALTAKEEEDTK